MRSGGANNEDELKDEGEMERSVFQEWGRTKRLAFVYRNQRLMRKVRERMLAREVKRQKGKESLEWIKESEVVET